MGTPLHPALVHLPLGLAIVVPLLAVGLTVALWRGWLPKKAWYAVVALQALTVVAAVLAMRTGEGDEDRVERIVGEVALEAHAEAAELFTWGAGVVLAMTIVVLLLRRVELARIGAAVAAAGTLVVALLAIRVGHAGGELVYTHGAASAFTTGSAAAGGAAPVGGEGGGEAGEREHDRD